MSLLPLRPTRPEDPVAELLFATAGDAIGHWLEVRGKLSQPIRSLQRHELMGMAWAAISSYLDKRAELERQEQQAKPLPNAPLGI